MRKSHSLKNNDGVFGSRWIAEALPSAPKDSGREQRFSRFHTDSRTCISGDLFVALPGERVDGHDFIGQALEKGASGVLCKRGKFPAGLSTPYLLEVEDPLKAFRTLSGAWRKRFDIPVIAVAGSVGKTTTKEFIAALLSAHYGSVLKTEKSQNGFIGIPMTLLALRNAHMAASIEIGIDEVGALEAHYELVRPTAGVLTAIEEEHLATLHDIETVTLEEGKLLELLARDQAPFIANFDDERVRGIAKNLPAKKLVSASLQEPAMLKGKLDGEILTLQGMGADGVKLTCPLPGVHQARNLLLACATALAAGVSASKLKAGLENFEAPVGRMNVKRLADGSVILLDYYNASPASMRAAFKSVQGSPKIFCLGDMLELGPDELDLHRGLASDIVKSGAVSVLLYGPRMKALKEELKSNRYTGNVEHFETLPALAHELKAQYKPGAGILFKGSRGMAMERAWEEFRKGIGA